ncbi:hypothetical protein RH831_02770 [Halodesulfurarchaeum sp. HSR-GB]|uniref:DUF7268 family protein n=1 Tax=Halodesulfurarchaeum sp. HSR-GB TaxID=3074077 RepID=UPI0028546544|nr:hypothetical protein [Halodesulfurarchaeum sp. HSR-GB]MDR5656102.1 hypothetical protein [Halodesulfurarchaeum sp. HSR-GB]
MRTATWAIQQRVRLVAPAGLVGVVLAVVFLTVLGLVGRSVPIWIDSTFAFGGIWFGFGLLSWASSIMLGRTIEGLQARMDLGTGWTETSSRRAMARVAAFGAGMMIGATGIGLIVF